MLENGFLRPLSHVNPYRLAVYDIETVEARDNPIEFYAAGFFDGEGYYYFRDLEKFLQHVLSQRYSGWHIFAHNGGRFDVLFILDELERTSGFTGDVISSGSCVVGLTIRSKTGKRVWHFNDSFRLLQSSLARLTMDFKVAHKKLDFDPTSRAYNENDCRGLYEVLQEFFGIFGVYATTIAGESLRIFRYLYQHQDLAQIPSHVETAVRAAYKGGRCEVFRYGGAELNCYDFNSLYPHAMVGMVPIRYAGTSRKLFDTGFYWVVVDYPDCYLPVLPLHTAGKLYFPVGRFEGWFSGLEVRLAQERGAEVKIHTGYIFDEDDIFSGFVSDLYERKRNADTAGDMAKRYVYKLLANSLYGKFAQRREQLLYRMDGRVCSVVPRSSFGRHILPHISAYVTARARMKLLVGLESAGVYYYCDTDSIYTPVALRTGEGLGELKLEGNGRFQAYEPKLYQFGDKFRAKGIGRGFGERGTNEDRIRSYIKGEEVSVRAIAGFRESLRAHESFARLVEKPKMRRNAHGKRARTGSDTRPWGYHELRELP